MTPARLFFSALTLSLAASSCAVFHRHHKEVAPPVVETVRTPDSPTPPTAARDLADAMTTVLHLRPDQTTRVRQVLSSTVDQVNSARKQYPAQSPQLNSALAHINSASDKQIRTILGPTSYREMQVKRAQIQAEMQRH
jgi:predicted ATPase